MAHTRLNRGSAPLRRIHRHSWVALAVTWVIWVVNAFDREVILRLGPVITHVFSLSPAAWGALVSVVMFSLALLAVPGSLWSDRYGGGWKRARFQVPLVIGSNLLSAFSGFRLLAHNLVAFIALRVGVNLGAGWGEPVGVSNTTEWWPRERRGFALGAHHTGYPVGALFSGIAASWVLATFGDANWSYVFFFGIIVAIPVMLFWAKYSTQDRMTELHRHIEANEMTVSAAEAAPQAGRSTGAVRHCLRDRTILFTAGNTCMTQIVYMGISVVLPLYLSNIEGFSFAASAGLSVVFTLTGILGQVLWPSVSDYLGRRLTLMICGVWMAIGVGAFYLASGVTAVIAIQLFFGLVANAVWPIYYAAASDSAPQEARSTANGIITSAMYVGGGLSPILMGWLVGLGGGWHASKGYVICFLFMAGCALVGVVCQSLTRESVTTALEPAELSTV